MSITLEVIQHYPWLPSTKNFYSEMASKDPIDFISDIITRFDSGEIQDRVLEFFKSAFDNLEHFDFYQIDELNVYMYLIIKILLYIMNDNRISNRIANLYSKVTYAGLVNENDYNLYHMCKDLQIDIQYNTKPWIFRKNIVKNQVEIMETHFKLHYIDYIELASHLRDDYRKLVNNSLSEGYVFLLKQNLCRLLQEHVRKKFLDGGNVDASQVELMKKKLLSVNKLQSLYENILHEWELRKEKFEFSSEITYKDGVDLSGAFPPCLRDMLKRAEEGQNLTHIERLFMVFMLHALEYPEDKVIDVFSTMPDFDREKTAYQVRFAKTKGYSPHSCATLSSFNLCLADKYKDKLCLEGYFSKKDDEQKKISHPLFYIQFKQFVQNSSKKSDKKENENGKGSSK